MGVADQNFSVLFRFRGQKKDGGKNGKKKEVSETEIGKNNRPGKKISGQKDRGQKTPRRKSCTPFGSRSARGKGSRDHVVRGETRTETTPRRRSLRSRSSGFLSPELAESRREKKKETKKQKQKRTGKRQLRRSAVWYTSKERREERAGKGGG